MATRNQAGSGSLIAIFGLLALGIAGGLYFVFTGGPAGNSARATRAARGIYDANITRLERALANQAAFDASLEHNASSFQCLYANDGKCQGQGGTFLLFEGGSPVSQMILDAGLDENGRPCRGFPSAGCPLRVETVWEPVCSGADCESTKSARVKAKVTLAAVEPGEAPLEWTKDAMFTPSLQLSQSSQCGRGGGEWTGTECLTPAQMAERRVASPAGARMADAPMAQVPEAVPAPEPTPPAEAQKFECPGQIVVSGQNYPVQPIANERAQVMVPAMSCPNGGAVDTFVFQCVAKSPSTFPNEGQWIQVEAQMAPACDGNGNPPGGNP